MGRAYNHWSDAEVAALKEGVARFGVGNWQKMVNEFPVLRQRTGVQLKDKYRNMIKFRHLAANEMGGATPPTQRRTAPGRAAARRSPAPTPAAPAPDAADPSAGAGQAGGAQPPAAATQAEQPSPAAPRRAGGGRAAREAAPPPPLSAAEQQARLAEGQAAAQQRLHRAQAAVQALRVAYVSHLVAAAVAAAASGAARDEAAASEAAGAAAVGALRREASLQQRQAEAVAQQLAAARGQYLQAAEELQGAQAAANAAATAVLQAAESAADAGPALPPADGRVTVAALPPLRASNRRKAALNRKRFLEDGGEEEPHSRPLSALSGGGASAFAAVQPLRQGDEPHPRPASASGGKRRRSGAQKRLHEDTRFGIYDDRRYRADGDGDGDGDGGEQAPPSLQRRRLGFGLGGGGGSGRGRVGGAGVRQKRRRRRPRHLVSEFAFSDDDDDEGADELDAELAEADEEEEEWGEGFRGDSRDVDCPCGTAFDDGEELVECEGCGVWAHLACLARCGRLRHAADRYLCPRCQGFGSPLAGGTPTAAGALSPRGVAVALGARRQAFRQASARNDSFHNDELYDIAAFLDNRRLTLGGRPASRDRERERESSGGGSAPPRSASAPAQPSPPPAGPGSPAGLALPAWGGAGPRRRRRRRSGGDGGEAWPCAGVTAAPPRKRYRLPPPHPGFAAGFPHSPLAAWQQLPLVAAGLAAARLSGLHPHPHLQPAALPPFMPLSASPSPALPPAAAMAAAAAAAAAAATAGMSLGRGWDHAANDGGGGGGEQENKAAAVAELMQIMQGAQQGLGLPPPRPTLPAGAASALLSSQQPTPSPPLDLMHRDLHDADLQDDLQAQDWLAAAASLARADSQPTYPAFTGGPLDGGHMPGPPQPLSLGGSPARPPSLLGGLPPPPPLGGMGDAQQHWLAVVSSMQQQQQQQQRGLGPRGGEPSAAASAAVRPPLFGGGLAAQDALPGPASSRGGGGAAAGSHRRQPGALSALDEAQERDGFGRYRQGSFPSLQQLAPDLQVGGLHGLTPTASGRADGLMSDDDADIEGPHLLISAAAQGEDAAAGPGQQGQEARPPGERRRGAAPPKAEVAQG